MEQVYTCGFGSYGTLGTGVRTHAQATLMKIPALSDKQYYDEVLGTHMPVRTGLSLTAGLGHAVAAQVRKLCRFANLGLPAICPVVTATIFFGRRHWFSDRNFWCCIQTGADSGDACGLALLGCERAGTAWRREEAQ